MLEGPPHSISDRFVPFAKNVAAFELGTNPQILCHDLKYWKKMVETRKKIKNL
jgi:hypothetical protein